MKKEIKIGIFAIVVLIAGWGVIRFLKGAEIFSNSNTYYAYYTQVGGIQAASNVVIYGVPVGAVSKVTLNEDPSKGVEVEFTVNKRYNIPVDSKARIFSDGIMGGKAIEIVYGKSTEYVPRRGTIESEASTDIMEMATSEIDFLNEKISTVVDGLSQTLTNVNSLLADNTANLTSIVKNVDGVANNVNTLLVGERAHLEQALSSLSQFSKSLGDHADDLGGIIDNMNRFSTELANANLAQELESVAGHINGVLETIKEQSGSVGKLINDSELYDNLTSASDNLSALLEDLKQNPHRYINISVFGANPTKKVEKAKAKAKADKHAIKRADELAEKEHEQQIKSLEQGK